jgi:hypothetical protein
VPGAVISAVCGVHTAAYDGVVVHEDAAYGRFGSAEGEGGLGL